MRSECRLTFKILLARSERLILSMAMWTRGWNGDASTCGVVEVATRYLGLQKDSSPSYHEKVAMSGWPSGLRRQTQAVLRLH